MLALERVAPCIIETAAVKKWLEDEYPVIAACAKVEGVEIHRGDETGLRSDDVRGRGYAPKGERRSRG